MEPPSVGTETSPPRTAVGTGTGDLDEQILAAPLESGVRRNPDVQVEIAAGAALGGGPLTGGAHAHAVLHAGRNAHLHRA